MCKHNCNECAFDNTVIDSDYCGKKFDNRKYNLYNNQVISGQIYNINRSKNFDGKCPYFEKKKIDFFEW